MILLFCPPVWCCGRLYPVPDRAAAEGFRCPESGAAPPYWLLEADWLAFPSPQILYDSPGLWPSRRKHRLARLVTRHKHPVWRPNAPGGMLPYDDAAICHLIRDVLGNPFRPAAIRREWLTPDVRAVAESIYTRRRFEDVPVLGDALEEGGCVEDLVLRHCRDEGPHVRGCWVVDRILGKV